MGHFIVEISAGVVGSQGLLLGFIALAANLSGCKIDKGFEEGIKHCLFQTDRQCY